MWVLGTQLPFSLRQQTTLSHGASSPAPPPTSSFALRSEIEFQVHLVALESGLTRLMLKTWRPWPLAGENGHVEAGAVVRAAKLKSR